jgi:UDP-2,4-diacetamido-2,4,6-trideoxy-beta-L-altropyranose hydrolase
MNVFFRVDSSASIGFGHVMRCLVLGEKLRDMGANVFFVCRSFEHSLIPKIKKLEFKVFVLDRSDDLLKFERDSCFEHSQIQDARMTKNAIRGFRVDWLIVDSYALGLHWETEMRESVMKIMVIDDLADRKHDCDLFLNQNSAEVGLDYKKSINGDTLVLLGPRYALLRNEFHLLRPKSLEQVSKIERVLIFLSGGDDSGETLKAMLGVREYGTLLEVDVVIGASNIHVAEIRDLCVQYNWNFLMQIDNLADRMAKADIVIGSCGTNAWERCTLGKPSISVVLATNQRHVAETLKQYDASEVIGFYEEVSHQDYCIAMKKMTKEKMFKMANNAFNLVDASGAKRVCDVLLS